MNCTKFFASSNRNRIEGFARKISFSSINRSMTDHEFKLWFAGFTDAEGNFDINFTKVLRIQFRITLHIDDIEVLYFIQSKLGFGTVAKSKTRFEAVFSISGVKNLNKSVIQIFNLYKLNGNKYLDYLVFKKVIEMMIELLPSGGGLLSSRSSYQWRAN